MTNLALVSIVVVAGAVFIWQRSPAGRARRERQQREWERHVQDVTVHGSTAARRWLILRRYSFLGLLSSVFSSSAAYGLLAQPASPVWHRVMCVVVLLLGAGCLMWIAVRVAREPELAKR